MNGVQLNSLLEAKYEKKTIVVGFWVNHFADKTPSLWINHFYSILSKSNCECIAIVTAESESEIIDISCDCFAIDCVGDIALLSRVNIFFALDVDQAPFPITSTSVAVPHAMAPYVYSDINLLTGLPLSFDVFLVPFSRKSIIKITDIMKAYFSNIDLAYRKGNFYILECVYPKHSANHSASPYKFTVKDVKTIIYAPKALSTGLKNSIANRTTLDYDLIAFLLNTFSDLHIIYRPYPTDLEHNDIRLLLQTFSSHKNFSLSTGNEYFHYYPTAIMITDYSSIVQGFAMTTNCFGIKFQPELCKTLYDKQTGCFYVNTLATLKRLIAIIIKNRSTVSNIISKHVTSNYACATNTFENIYCKIISLHYQSKFDTDFIARNCKNKNISLYLTELKKMLISDAMEYLLRYFEHTNHSNLWSLILSSLIYFTSFSCKTPVYNCTMSNKILTNYIRNIYPLKPKGQMTILILKNLFFEEIHKAYSEKEYLDLSSYGEMLFSHSKDTLILDIDYEFNKTINFYEILIKNDQRFNFKLDLIDFCINMNKHTIASAYIQTYLKAGIPLDCVHFFYSRLFMISKHFNDFDQAHEYAIKSIELCQGSTYKQRYAHDLVSWLISVYKYDIAEKFLVNSLHSEYVSVSMHYNLSNLYRRNNRLDDAEAIVKEAMELDPTQGEGYMQLSFIAALRQQDDLAIEHALKAIELKPEVFSWRYHLSNLYRRNNRLDDAEAIVKEAMELDPTQGEGYMQLSFIAASRQQDDLAIEHALKALELKPEVFSWRYHLSNLYRRNNRLDDAEAIVKEAMELDPTQGEGYMQLSFIAASRQQDDLAIEHALKAIELKPEVFSWRYHLSNLYRRSNRLDDAEAIVKEAMELDLTPAEAYYQLAKISEAREEFSVALELVEKALSLRETDAYKNAHQTILKKISELKPNTEIQFSQESGRGENTTNVNLAIPEATSSPLNNDMIIKFISETNMFDREYYLTSNMDIARAKIDPIEHYVNFGAKELRNPTGWFDTAWYYQQYSDVAAAGVNPFWHFLRFGFFEGRLPKFVEENNLKSWIDELNLPLPFKIDNFGKHHDS